MARALPQGKTLERFRRDLAALRAGDGPLAVAVSGGPDSLALLLLAAAARPGALHAATVDHRLRGESADEARFVADVCAALGVPHATLPVAIAATGAGLQADARAARYAALAAWMMSEGLGTLLTGHHADDQAETLLMRLQRGSGIGGLAGIRPRAGIPGKNGRLTVARPLLSWRRTELARIVAEAGLEPVEDPSNADPEFDRVRMRKRLSEAGWLDPEAIARSAAALAEADDALEIVAARLWEERVRREGSAVLLEPRGIPPELLRRLVLLCLRAVLPGVAPRGGQLGALLASLAVGTTITLAGVKCSGGSRYRFERAPPRRS